MYPHSVQILLTRQERIDETKINTKWERACQMYLKKDGRGKVLLHAMGQQKNPPKND